MNLRMNQQGFLQTSKEYLPSSQLINLSHSRTPSTSTKASVALNKSTFGAHSTHMSYNNFINA